MLALLLIFFFMSLMQETYQQKPMGVSRSLKIFTPNIHDTMNTSVVAISLMPKLGILRPTPRS